MYIEHFCSEVKGNEVAVFGDVRCNVKKESFLCLWAKTLLLTPHDRM